MNMDNKEIQLFSLLINIPDWGFDFGLEAYVMVIPAKSVLQVYERLTDQTILVHYTDLNEKEKNTIGKEIWQFLIKCNVILQTKLSLEK